MGLRRLVALELLLAIGSVDGRLEGRPDSARAPAAASAGSHASAQGLLELETGAALPLADVAAQYPYIAWVVNGSGYDYTSFVGVNADGSFGALLGNVKSLNAVEDWTGSLRCVGAGAGHGASVPASPAGTTALRSAASSLVSATNAYTYATGPRCFFLRYYDGDATTWIWNASSTDGHYNKTRDVYMDNDTELNVLEVVGAGGPASGVRVLVGSGTAFFTWQSGESQLTKAFVVPSLANVFVTASAMCADGIHMWLAAIPGSAPTGYPTAYLVDTSSGNVVTNITIMGYVDEGTQPVAIVCSAGGMAAAPGASTTEGTQASTGAAAPGASSSSPSANAPAWTLLATLINPYTGAPAVSQLLANGTWVSLYEDPSSGIATRSGSDIASVTGPSTGASYSPLPAALLDADAAAGTAVMLSVWSKAVGSAFLWRVDLAAAPITSTWTQLPAGFTQLSGIAKPAMVA